MASKNLLPEFLEAYKELETTIRANADRLTRLSWLDGYTKYSSTVTVLDVENGISDNNIKDKLKTCRMIRNYAQHHDDADEFVSATQGMIDFVKKMTQDVRLLNGTYKDVMTKCPVIITTASNAADCAKAFAKTDLDWYPVLGGGSGGRIVAMTGDGTIVGIITKSAVFKMLASGSTLKTKIKDYVTSVSKSGVVTVKQTDPIPVGGIPKKTVIVNTRGSIVGITE